MFKNFLSAPFKKNTGLKNGAGLTLIELLVVISIMMTMTAVVFVNYRPGNQQLALNRSASKLAQDIRRAQEMAMSSAEVNGVVPDGIGVLIALEAGPPPPLGIEKSRFKYYIYADFNEDKKFSGTIVDTLIDIVDFEPGVLVQTIKIDGIMPVPATLQRHYIYFMPPDPEVTILKRLGAVAAGSTEIGSWVDIILTLETDSSKTKTVVVNSAGLIYVE